MRLRVCIIFHFISAIVIHPTGYRHVGVQVDAMTNRRCLSNLYSRPTECRNAADNDVGVGPACSATDPDHCNGAALTGGRHRIPQNIFHGIYATDQCISWNICYLMYFMEYMLHVNVWKWNICYTSMYCKQILSFVKMLYKANSMILLRLLHYFFRPGHDRHGHAG